MTWRSIAREPAPAARDRGNAAEVPSAEAEPEEQRRLEAARQQGRTEGEALGAQRAGQLLEPVIAALSPSPGLRLTAPASVG